MDKMFLLNCAQNPGKVILIASWWFRILLPHGTSFFLNFRKNQNYVIRQVWPHYWANKLFSQLRKTVLAISILMETFDIKKSYSQNMCKKLFSKSTFITLPTACLSEEIIVWEISIHNNFGVLILIKLVI